VHRAPQLLNSGGYSQQQLGQQHFQQSQYPQPSMFYPAQQINKSLKRRPGTAGRRQQFKLPKGFQSINNNLVAPVSAKASNFMEIQISKLRPNKVNQERERLYDDVMKQRMTTNVLREENVKLKTRLLFVENEVAKKDKIIDDLLVQQENNFSVPKPKFTAARVGGIKVETHLVINLKRKIRDINTEKQTLIAEIDALKRNIRSTKLSELEVENKLYADECARLRHQLEEVIKSKDTFADPQELKLIEQKFQQRDIVISQMQTENANISQALNKKDEENRQLAELVQEMERRMKKAIAAKKEGSKFKKETSEKEKEISRLRKEVIDLKHANTGLNAQIKELKEAKPTPSITNSAPK